MFEFKSFGALISDLGPGIIMLLRMCFKLCTPKRYKRSKLASSLIKEGLVGGYID